jgi:hypothetical protein
MGTMRHTQHLLRSAPIAIAAMLALGPTHAGAQDVTVTAAPTAQQPPMVLPVDPIPVPAPTSAAEPRYEPSPTVQSVPVETATAEPEPSSAAATTAPSRTTTPSSRNVAASTQRVSNASRATPSTPAGASTQTAPVAATDLSSESPIGSEVIVPPLAMPENSAVSTDPVDTPEQAGMDWTAMIALAMLGLIPVSVIALAVIWWRRRSSVARDMRASDAAPLTASRIAAEREPRTAMPRPPIFDREPIVGAEARTPSPALPDATYSPPVTKWEPAGSVTTLDRAPVEAPVEARKPVDRSAFLPRDGKVILPDAVPETFEERDRLMRGLVAQEPDAANPFRSGRARARRARLIIQSLGRKFESATPWIDLSQYSYRWPHLAQSRTNMV